MTGLPALPLIAAIAVTARAASGTGKGRAEWSPIPGAELRSVYPSKAMLIARRCRGVSGPSAVLGAWCGWAWDVENEIGYLLAHGGHTDYGGNEVYRWTFAQGWERLNDPDYVNFALNKGKGLPSSPDGLTLLDRPASTHTYAREFVLDGVPYLMGSANGWSGGQTRRCWKFNLTDLTWTELATMPGSSEPSGGAFDKVSGKFIGFYSQYKTATYDPDANVWTSVAGPRYTMGKSVAIHEARRLMCVLARNDKGIVQLHSYPLGSAGQLGADKKFDLGVQMWPRTDVLTYHPDLEIVLVWTGTRMAAFDGDTLTEVAMPALPGVLAKNGLYNKVSWSKSQGGFVVPFNDRETWLLKVAW